MRIALELNREDLNALQYPVVVERWDHRKDGKGRRTFMAAFPTQAERNTCKVWYDKFYRWYLVKGTPATCHMQASTLEFLKKMVNTFSQI